MNRNDTKKAWSAALVVALAALGPGCFSLEVPDLNNPSIESLTKNPTRSGVLSGATGLLIGHRTGVASTNGYVSMLGILGRESYCMDRADPRFITEMLEAPNLDSSSPAFGGNFWANPYANIRNANTILAALGSVPAMTTEEKQAVAGFARTIQALDFLIIHNTRWTNGGPIAVDRPLTEAPAPIVSKEAILAHAASLLDQARTDLGAVAAGGDAFPFPLSNGFIGFDQPSTFLTVNRAVRARVAVYQQDWAAAEAALAESFLDDAISAGDPVTDLEAGVYHSYGTGSGDLTNGLVSPNILAHPKLATEAEAGDARVSRKLRTLDAPVEARGLSSDQAFTLYAAPTNPLPIIKNEELVLLRAETRFHLGGAGNLAAAIDDLNLIRTSSGGLAARADLDATNFLDELLQQRRFSLMFEYGHRWIDLRRYDRLSDPGLKDLPAHNVHAAFPIPLAEQEARQ